MADLSPIRAWPCPAPARLSQLFSQSELLLKCFQNGFFFHALLIYFID